MANQPAAGVHGHYISSIPDELWDDTVAVAAAMGESVSAAVRRGMEEYVKQNRWRIDDKERRQ